MLFLAGREASRRGGSIGRPGREGLDQSSGPVRVARTDITRRDGPYPFDQSFGPGTDAADGERGLERGPLTALSQRKLNALGTPIAYIDRNQRYRFVNKALLDWFGKRSDEVLGREIIEVLGRESYQLYRAYIDAALGGERTGYEWQLALPGRQPLWMRVDYYPDRNQQGHIRGFLATYSDVDHLKRLELEAGQREHRLRLVTDSVGLPILHFDRQLRLRFANKPFADWIGVPAEDLLGHSLADFLPSDALTEMQGYIERAFAGATVAYERRERRASGELRWVRVTLFPDREMGGRVGGAFVVWNDIEDDVRVRDALKSQQSQLRLFADNIPGPDRVSRQEPALHVRQPGVRELGVQAAGRDLRQDAVRGDGVRRRRVPASGAEARAGGRARRIRAHRPERRTASAAGCTAGWRPTSIRPARCAACIAPNTTSTT